MSAFTLAAVGGDSQLTPKCANQERFKIITSSICGTLKTSPPRLGDFYNGRSFPLGYSFLPLESMIICYINSETEISYTAFMLSNCPAGKINAFIELGSCHSKFALISMVLMNQ